MWTTKGQQIMTVPSPIPIDQSPFKYRLPTIAVSYALNPDGRLLATGGGIYNYEALFFQSTDASSCGRSVNSGQSLAYVVMAIWLKPAIPSRSAHAELTLEVYTHA